MMQDNLSAARGIKNGLIVAIIIWGILYLAWSGL